MSVTLRRVDERHFQVVTYADGREVASRPATTTEIWRFTCGQPLTGFYAEPIAPKPRLRAARKVRPYVPLYRRGARARAA